MHTPTAEWYAHLARQYRNGDQTTRSDVLAAVLHEAAQWDAITRSVIILPNFERAVGQHICALWGDCEHIRD